MLLVACATDSQDRESQASFPSGKQFSNSNPSVSQELNFNDLKTKKSASGLSPQTENKTSNKNLGKFSPNIGSSTTSSIAPKSKNFASGSSRMADPTQSKIFENATTASPGNLVGATPPSHLQPVANLPDNSPAIPIAPEQFQANAAPEISPVQASASAVQASSPSSSSSSSSSTSAATQGSRCLEACNKMITRFLSESHFKEKVTSLGGSAFALELREEGSVVWENCVEGVRVSNFENEELQTFKKFCKGGVDVKQVTCKSMHIFFRDVDVSNGELKKQLQECEQNMNRASVHGRNSSLGPKGAAKRALDLRNDPALSDKAIQEATKRHTRGAGSTKPQKD